MGKAAERALEELRHLVEALKQTTARLDLVATRHDERLATLEHERGRRIMANQTNEALDKRVLVLEMSAASGECVGKAADRIYADKVQPQPFYHPAMQALDAEDERQRSEVWPGVSPLHAAAKACDHENRNQTCGPECRVPPAPPDPLRSFDAREWAREFMRLFSGYTVGKGDLDEGLMLSWFANALMRGFDEYRWKHEPERKLDEAYNERNRLVALLARIYPSGIRKTAIEGWDPCWHGCVFVDAPQGQMSWHYHDRDADLFAGLPPYTKPWDGHSTPEKYARLERLTRSYWAGINSGVGDVFHEAMNEAFSEGRRRERASLIGSEGITVIVHDHRDTLSNVEAALRSLGATRIVVDAGGIGGPLLRHLQAVGLPAEALPKGGT